MGRHSPDGRRRLLVPVLATSLVVVLGAAAWVTVSAVRSRPTCEQPVKVLVAASDDIAPALSIVARGLGIPCGGVEVQTKEAAATAEQLALSDGSPRPPGWGPGSTLALRRAHQFGAADVPESGASVASSPVVLAVAEDVAKGIGWGGRARPRGGGLAARARARLGGGFGPAGRRPGDVRSGAGLGRRGGVARVAGERENGARAGG